MKWTKIRAIKKNRVYKSTHFGQINILIKFIWLEYNNDRIKKNDYSRATKRRRW